MTETFTPPVDFQKNAHVRSMDAYQELYRRSIEDPEGFWSEQARALHWFEPFQRVLEYKAPDAKWFVGGKTNLCYNCVDRQVDEGFGDKVALVWEGEPMPDGHPEVRKLTYGDLKHEVSRFANVLRKLGVGKGDRVTLYMPMVPELVIAMLACARIGAPHSIIFGGFSAHAISDRVEDAQSHILITADGGHRRGKVLNLKGIVDKALSQTDRVNKVVVLERAGNDVTMKEGRDHWWHDLMADVSDDCPCEPMESEDLLFLLYTSGTTGKPKGIMHTTGGYMVHTYLTSKFTFDLHADDPDELYWCTADIGWITGHSYIVYGILPNRVPTLMYEGAPNHPGPDRFWDIVARHRVTKFYTAPTAIRAFMKWGDDEVAKHDISSLELLGTVGEPINPEAWRWYHRVIGQGRCPIVDTWWQTETGGHLITPMPGATPTVPGSATRPFLGIDAAVVDAEGNEVKPNEGGYLVIRKPWPSMLRGIYGNRERFLKAYWEQIDGMYFTGDGARRDEDGNFWITGRIDDVLNVSGHRLGTAEIESSLVAHPAVVEAAVVGIPHDLKGQAVAAFVILSANEKPGPELKKALIDHVAEDIGHIAKPETVRFTDALPKTRSGKIMRRLLKEVAVGGEVRGDTTTLEDRSVIERLTLGYSDSEKKKLTLGS